MTASSGPPGCEGEKRKLFLLLTPKVRFVLWALFFGFPLCLIHPARISPVARQTLGSERVGRLVIAAPQSGAGKTTKIPPGSTAELAVWLEAPVVLVVNAQGQGQSIAALIKGFEEFHPQLHLASVIFNRVGGAHHARLLTHAVETYCRARVLGSIPRDAEISIPERHLGLQTADDFQSSSFVLGSPCPSDD